jgi:enolase-phosphatase E1
MRRMATTDVYLLDIEGTTSSVRFVYDVLFPYARKHFASFLAHNQHVPEVQAAIAQMTGQSHTSLDSALAEANRLMDADAKQTGLKSLQGMIWKSGYETGELVSHVYEDTAPAMQRFKQRGAKIYIYSSGSVEAQKQFFAHTVAGPLSALIDGYFDTAIGGKRMASSYANIADKIGASADKIMFYSDITEELDAAKEAGASTTLVLRPGSKPVETAHRTVVDFSAE